MDRSVLDSIPPFLRPSTARRLAFWVLLGSIAVLAASLGYVLHSAQSSIQALRDETLKTLTQAGGQAISARVNGVEATARMIAATISRHLDNPAFIETLLRESAVSHPDIDGISAAFEPGVVADRPAYAPFFAQQGGHIMHRDLAGDADPYREAGWYRHALDCAAGCWGEIFRSKSRDKLLISYSVPIRVAGDRVVGVLNADLPQQWLQQIMDGIHLGEASRGFLISDKGAFLTNSTPSHIATSLFDFARSTDTPELADIAGRMIAGEEGSLAYFSPSLDTPARAFFGPVPGSKWSLALVVPQDTYTRDAQRIAFKTGAVTYAALALLGLLVWLAVHRLLAPLAQLVDKADHVARGDLDFRLDAPRRLDEVGLLTQSFLDMRDELKHHIADLTEATAARERLQSELAIAQHIQESMLPSDRFAKHGRGAFELRALLKPAKTVGGDLYGYFMQNSGRLCFLIGDVSDKGIPVALFMARTITSAQAAAAHVGPAQELRPDAILRQLNAELCQGNDSCMFVTMLCGVLDLDSGHLTLASAGHDPPLRVGAGSVTTIHVETGGPLGLDEDMEFPCGNAALTPDDAIVLYTDGVTEARDTTEALFGEERLHDVLAANRERTPDALVDAVAAAVDAFVRGAPPADDLTLLALRWHGAAAAESSAPPRGVEFAIGGTLAEVEAALDRIEAWLTDGGVGLEKRSDVRVALEELLVNTVSYGYAGAAQTPSLALRLDHAGDRLDVALWDNGIAFDPFAMADPDLDADRESGGLGVFLVRQLADAYAWRRDGERNHVELRFHLATQVEDLGERA